MSPTPPRVSIVMPCYRAAPVLEGTLRSVMAQTYRHWELILVDDCSGDGTVELARRLVQEDSRIHVLENPENLGAEGNWNRALQQGRGEYLKLLCSDDLLSPDCLEAQVAALDHPANTGVVLVSARRDVIDPNGKRVFKNWGLGPLVGRFSGAEVVRACVRAGTNLVGEPSIALFRKEASDRAGLFQARYPYMIDIDFWFRLLKHGDFLGLDSNLGAFRIWPGSWSTRLARQQFAQADAFFAEILTREWPGVLPRSDRWKGRATLFLKCHLRRLVLNLQKLKTQAG